MATKTHIVTHIVTHNGKAHLIRGCMSLSEAATRFMSENGIERRTPCTAGTDGDSYYRLTMPGLSGDTVIEVHPMAHADRARRMALASAIRSLPRPRQAALWRAFVKGGITTALHVARAVEHRRTCLDSQMREVSETVRRVRAEVSHA